MKAYSGRPSFSEETIRRQVERIARGSAFTQSERMSRFLRFAVERALTGCAEELKEYLIGVEVFDRSPSYDPRVDPIVRVEARRLRAKLQAYYESEGQADELVIEFPKGSYVPLFRGASAGDARRPVAGATPIAVLPFANLSQERENEYFSDGLTEELIHRLTKARGLRVVAWNSASRLRDRAEDPCQIGRELGVASVLRGSVRRDGSQLRITAQLIDTSSGSYLWSESFERRVEDVFAIQDEISRAIAQTLQLRLAASQPSGVAQRTALNLEAYNHYLKGRFHWNKRTEEGFRKSIREYEVALTLDPHFALAYVGLSDSYSMLAQYGLAAPTGIMPKARSAATQALALDPTLAEAEASLGLIRSVYDWQWGDAERHYLRAIELNPGYASARHWYSLDYLANLGRLDEAMDQIDFARQLDPLSPIIVEGKAYLYLLARRYDESVMQLRELIDLEPSFHRVYPALGRVFAQMGRYDEAVAMLEKGRSLLGDVPSILGALGQTHAWAGRAGEARLLLSQLEGMAGHRWAPVTALALIHAGLGETNRAVEWLELGCERREMPNASIAVHPAYDALRQEPGFIALLSRMGLS